MNSEDLVGLGSSLNILENKLQQVKQFIMYLHYSADKDENGNISPEEKQHLDYIIEDFNEFYQNHFIATFKKEAILQFEVQDILESLENDNE